MPTPSRLPWPKRFRFVPGTDHPLNPTTEDPETYAPVDTTLTHRAADDGTGESTGDDG